MAGSILIHAPRQVAIDTCAPPSKSHTARALVAAALANGPSTLRMASTGTDDTRLMIEGLKRLGARVEASGLAVEVQPAALPRCAPDGIYCGNAGTTLRFLAGVSALADGTTQLDGSPRMRERPIGELGTMLEQLGARVEYADRPGFPPVRISGGAGGLRGGMSVEARSGVSSQFISALLLIAPRLSDGLDVSIRSLPSRPYVDMTVDIMIRFGAKVERIGEDRLLIGGAGYSGSALDLEGDASGAAFLLAAAAIAGGCARIRGIPLHSIQPDLALLRILEQAGCEVTRKADTIELTSGGALDAFSTDLRDSPDLAPAVAALAAVAHGKSTISGLAALRHKESDRLAVIQRELRRMSIDAVSPDGESLVITGGDPAPARIDPENDHRIAMAFAVLGLRAPGTVITNPACVTKSFPRFFEELGLTDSSVNALRS